MKTLLILLLMQFPLVQQDQTFIVVGITARQWIVADTNQGVFINAQTDKLSDYVDFKIKIARQTIISPVFFETNKGKFSMPIYDQSKYGYSIIRLYFRLKEQWVSIDSGIAYLVVKTDKKTYRIQLNLNLNKLKTYANVK